MIVSPSENTPFVYGMVAMAVFAACAVLRPFLIKKIVQSTGGAWNFNTPFRNITEERKALRSLPQGKLRNELRIINTIAICSWLLGVGVLLAQRYKK